MEVLVEEEEKVRQEEVDAGDGECLLLWRSFEG
jgi:hypothetical protein